MAGAKTHDYHILAPDVWPLIGALSALTFTTGMVFFMHSDTMVGWQVILGLSFVLVTLFAPKGIGGLFDLLKRGDKA